MMRLIYHSKNEFLSRAMTGIANGSVQLRS
jgi:hypothetical protein